MIGAQVQASRRIFGRRWTICSDVSTGPNAALPGIPGIPGPDSHWLAATHPVKLLSLPFHIVTVPLKRGKSKEASIVVREAASLKASLY